MELSSLRQSTEVEMSLIAKLPKEVIVDHIFKKLEFPDKLSLAMSTVELNWLKPKFDSLEITIDPLSRWSVENYYRRLFDFEVTHHVREIWVTSATWKLSSEDMFIKNGPKINFLPTKSKF